MLISKRKKRHFAKSRCKDNYDWPIISETQRLSGSGFIPSFSERICGPKLLITYITGINQLLFLQLEPETEIRA